MRYPQATAQGHTLDCALQAAHKGRRGNSKAAPRAKFPAPCDRWQDAPSRRGQRVPVRATCPAPRS